MYQPVTQFPEITNRESWQQIITLADDATGEPLNLTNAAGAGTFSAWSVAVSDTLYGPVLFFDASESSLSVGDGSFAAVMSPDLDLIAGQFVLFTPPADTSQYMQGEVNSYDPDTGDILFTVATVSIDLEIRRVEGGWGGRSGYGPNYSLGSYDWSAPILCASIGNGIEIIDTGVIQVDFSRQQFRSLSPGMHAIAATLTSADGEDTRQLFIGRLPVAFGGVN